MAGERFCDELNRRELSCEGERGARPRPRSAEAAWRDITKLRAGEKECPKSAASWGRRGRGEWEGGGEARWLAPAVQERHAFGPKKGPGVESFQPQQKNTTCGGNYC